MSCYINLVFPVRYNCFYRHKLCCLSSTVRNMVAHRHLWLFSSEVVKDFIENYVETDTSTAKHILTIAHLYAIIDA